jgi:hypothetical protein
MYVLRDNCELTSAGARRVVLVGQVSLCAVRAEASDDRTALSIVGADRCDQ